VTCGASFVWVRVILNDDVIFGEGFDCAYDFDSVDVFVPTSSSSNS